VKLLSATGKILVAAVILVVIVVAAQSW